MNRTPAPADREPGLLPLIRSFLFAPANRADLAAKFDRQDADCYVLDLEDGTPVAARAEARRALPDLVRRIRAGRLSGTLFLRTNEPGSADLAPDLEAALACGDGLDGIVVPKLETASDLPAIESRLQARPGRRVPHAIIGGIESMAGVLDVRAIAASSPHLVALYFGAEDFAADLGGRRTRDGAEVLYARSRVVLAARAARLAAIDQAVVDIRDDELYRRDGQAGRDLGYTGKICVLPRQVGIANEVFSPDPDAVDHARRLITAYAAAAQAGRGTIEFEGAMIDGPLLKRARALLHLAERIERRRPRDAG